MCPLWEDLKLGVPEAGKALQSIIPATAKEWYTSPTKSSGNFFVSGESGSFGIGTDYTNAWLKGAVSGVVKDPLSAVINAGIGIGLAATGEYLAGYGANVVASTAESGPALQAVARGTNWVINTGAPIVLGGLYATDIAGRSTSWGTDFTPTAAQKLGVISSTEVGPMILGGVAFANRGAIAESIRTSNVGDYFSNFKTTLSGEPGVSIETRPVALSDITGTKSTIYRSIGISYISKNQCR